MFPCRRSQGVHQHENAYHGSEWTRKNIRVLVAALLTAGAVGGWGTAVDDVQATFEGSA
jgi:hypothetical protein